MSYDSRPAEKAAAITPNDSTDLSPVPRAIYVGSAGDVVLVAAGDTDSAAVTFSNVPAGTVLPIKARRVKAAGTSAANLVALH